MATFLATLGSTTYFYGIIFWLGIRTCLNLTSEISYGVKACLTADGDAICTSDEVIATQQGCYEKLVLVFK